MAAPPLQGPQPLAPKQHRLALQAGGPNQGGVIKQALETGGILQQAAATKHQGPAAPQRLEHQGQAAARHRINPEALPHQGTVVGRNRGLITRWQLGQQHLKQGVVTQVVLAVVAAKQQPLG